MPETCENWPDLVNICVYYAHQARGIYQIFERFEIHWVRRCLVIVALFEMKDLQNKHMKWP